MKTYMDPVLIVDDEKDNLEAIRRLLRNQYEVTICSSPVEALKLIVKTEYHVIVSDQRMPEMSGVELLEKVKTVCPNTTRILLTGYTDIESVISAINRGNIYRYVAKPWDPEDLRQTLRQANEAYSLRKELHEKNAALERSNAELKQALEDLRLLDRAKARFLSLISHELNTPLTSVTAFVGLLGEKTDDFSDDVRRAVGSLSSASDRLSEIVSEVLTYVKLESENRWQSTEFAWDKETVAAVEAVEPERARRQIAMTVKASGVVKSHCDPEKTRIALRMLLKDAIARSPERKEVRIEISGKAGRLAFSVWREGEPLSPQALQPLDFDGEPLHHHRNLGLGLAIAKFAFERQGGGLELNSSKQAGTTLTAYLPQQPK